MSGHGGNLHAAALKYGRQDFIDFSANINPLGPPPGVFKAIEQHMVRIIHYPDPDGAGLKTALSHRLGIPAGNIVLGNGAVEVIYLLAQTIAPRRVLLPEPTFGEYARAMQSVGAELEYCSLHAEENFSLKPAQFDPDGCDLAFICNPNNPTGQLMTETDFVALLNTARKHNTLVVVDESFMDFVEPVRQWRACKYLNSCNNLFVLYSLTKFYAIPGLRVGCGAGSPGLIARLDKVKSPWNINSLALAAAEAALQDEEYELLTRRSIESERAYLETGLNKFRSLTHFPGNANFILVRNTAPLNGTGLVEQLAHRGILIRDCSNFPGLGPEYFRIAVKDRGSNEQLLQLLQEFLE